MGDKTSSAPRPLAIIERVRVLARIYLRFASKMLSLLDPRLDKV
jgi:hypothetical protein